MKIVLPLLPNFEELLSAACLVYYLNNRQPLEEHQISFIGPGEQVQAITDQVFVLCGRGHYYRYGTTLWNTSRYIERRRGIAENSHPVLREMRDGSWAGLNALIGMDALLSSWYYYFEAHQNDLNKTTEQISHRVCDQFMDLFRLYMLPFLEHKLLRDQEVDDGIEQPGHPTPEPAKDK